MDRDDFATPAVITAGSGRVLSHGELARRAGRLAAKLHERGLRSGDGVALLAENAPEAYEVCLAALRSGLDPVAVDTALSLDEAAYVVNDSEARALVAGGATLGLATALRPLTPRVDVRYAFDGEADGYEPYEDALTGIARDRPSGVRGAPMVYTAGVTGRPKGVVPDAARVATTARLLSKLCALRENTIAFLPVPLADPVAVHLATAVHDARGTVVSAAPFAPEDALGGIERHRVTLVHLVPDLALQLIALPSRVRARFDMSTVERVIVSGGPCPSGVLDALSGWWGARTTEIYGGAEWPVVAALDAEERAARPGSAGRAVEGTLHICDERGVELPTGRTGLVYLTGAWAEYHGAPGWSGAARHPWQTRWVTLGDRGSLDDRGYLYLAEPGMGEAVLAAHPAVAGVAVLTIPDAGAGERVRAVVRVVAGVRPGPPLAAELIEHVRDKCGDGQAPHTVDFVDDLPRTSAGKVLRRKLLHRYAMADGVLV
ncbi:AMP-binding protein [Amycolatopsis sp. K13G38]|uniref:AMP-binding protein n=1 Tax=Amycolatopsis acididurans TaxID=2724524 RepID=A0ABX1J364_9PSEU|nr:AMP-binding protein [Amycolatopsis acididurans]NKQ54216.1 AMP-binding protein [Amycolatopsis acididurans]